MTKQQTQERKNMKELINHLNNINTRLANIESVRQHHNKVVLNSAYHTIELESSNLNLSALLTKAIICLDSFTKQIEKNPKFIPFLHSSEHIG